MATIEVVHGDMFEGASDLLLVPCSHVPTISGFVRDRLENFELPIPNEPIPPGEVRFVELPKASTSIASTIGYAASVDQVGATPVEVIESIGRRAGTYCREQVAISAVHAPLLGAGAGGIYPVQSATAIAEGFLATAPDSAHLRLFVIDAEQHSLIVDAIKTGSESLSPSKKPLRVFISYTAKSGPEHASWVKDLATRLREDGINARLDAWHLSHGMDLPQWMCNELDQADRAVLVCDESYAQKADGRHGGVGWETRLIQGDLMASQADNPDKFIPVVVTEDMDAGTPKFLKATYAFHWPGRNEGSEYEELLLALNGAQESAPPIGKTPSFVLEALAKAGDD